MRLQWLVNYIIKAGTRPVAASQDGLAYLAIPDPFFFSPHLPCIHFGLVDSDRLTCKHRTVEPHCI